MKIKIYVQPNASRSEIVGQHGDAIKIKIKAPPVDGEANEEVVRFLSEFLKIPKKEIHILHGETSRTKLIEITVNAALEAEIQKKLK